MPLSFMVSLSFLSGESWLLKRIEERIRTKPFLKGRKINGPSFFLKGNAERRQRVCNRKADWRHKKNSNPMLPVHLGGLQMSLQRVVKSMAVPWPDLFGCCWLIKHTKSGRKLQPPPSQPLTEL